MAAMKGNKLAVMAFIVSLLLINMITANAAIPTFVWRKKSTLAGTVDCFSVVSVNQGDTCFSILQSAKLTVAAFDVINPNVNCDKLFVGQWICVDGSAV